MEQQFILKIITIQEQLKGKNYIKATTFDKVNEEAKALIDAKGAKWNKYLHKNCFKHDFEIWKNKSDENFYVSSNDASRDQARAKKLKEHSTANLLRGERRMGK